MRGTSVLSLIALSTGVSAGVSTYRLPVPRPTPGYTYEGWEAYDPTQPIVPPPHPEPMPNLDFSVTLDYSGNPKAGIPVPGSFLGISIEMSLAEAVIGPNSTWIWPQFLNIMSILKARGGSPVLRLGGNSQEKAKLVAELPRGHSIERHAIGPTSFTNTPTVLFTKGIFEAMRVVSDLLDIHWYIGMPMNQSQPARLEVIEAAEPILGDFIKTWHLGNEPDLYVGHGYRESYSIDDYLREFGEIRDQIIGNPNIKKKNMLGGPAICECGTSWTNAGLIRDHGYLDKFGDNLNALIIMHYPTDNCPDETGTRGTPEELQRKTQSNAASYAQHFGGLSATNFARRYDEVVELMQGTGKPIVLLETNTASCNGFLGISDSFLATLWNLDLALSLASSGFTHMMMHLGGQQAYYNPFMSPPWNSSEPFMWTVAPPMYSILVASEFIGPTNQARIADLGINNNETHMAGWVAYENNQPVRVLLMNYMSDESGAHDYTARLAVNNRQSVSVRYLEAPTITSKFGVHYANQTWGGYFESDGNLRGDQFTDVVPCTNGVCAIKVNAPGVAVVFLTDDLIFDAKAGPPASTYATTRTTKMMNTAAIPGAALHTNNGVNGEWRQKHLGSTSRKQPFNAALASHRPNIGWLLGVALSAFAVGVHRVIR